jgi:predicted membrane channel-forming protein YqfA (hemolysin III family)
MANQLPDKKASTKEVLLKEASEEPYIGDVSEAHEFQKIRSCLETGYRINFCTHELAKKTLFMIHNETVNVWSHAFGLAYFLVALAFVTFWVWTTKPEGS